MTRRECDRAITALTRARNACFHPCVFALAMLVALNWRAL